MKNHYAIGIDIGGTTTKFGIIDHRGDTLYRGVIASNKFEEVEPYLMDYVAQRIFGRNNYGEDWNKANFWTSEERSNIISIFADASQAETRAPITDTEYMRI